MYVCKYVGWESEVILRREIYAPLYPILRYENETISICWNLTRLALCYDRNTTTVLQSFRMYCTSLVSYLLLFRDSSMLYLYYYLKFYILIKI